MASGIRDKVAILGMGCSRFGERWEDSADDLMVEAFVEALEDAGIEKNQIDAAWFGTAIEEQHVGKSSVPLAMALRLQNIPVTRVENYCASGTEAFRGAVYAVASGACDIALAQGVEKLKDTGYGGLPQRSRGTANDLYWPNASAPGSFAQLASAYQAKHNINPDDLEDRPLFTEPIAITTFIMMVVAIFTGAVGAAGYLYMGGKAPGARQCPGGVVGAAIGGRNISLEPIQRLANEDIKDRALADIVAGCKGSSLAITEPSGGSDVANIKTTARKDGNHYVLNGSKTFITGGMKSDYFVVGARTGGPGINGISLFFVDANTPGFSRTALPHKMGWWCSDQATLYFDNCRVPATNVMGDENNGFIAIMKNFNYERLSMCASMLGMMKLCFSESVAYAQNRETFGKHLIHHQVIRHKLADMSAKIDALQSNLNIICWNANTGEMPAAEITKAKFFASKACEFCASEAMQILGGAGYLRGNPVERIYREVKVMAIGGGSEEIMRDLSMRQMGY